MKIDPMTAPSDQDFAEQFGVDAEAIDDLGGRRLRFENPAAAEALEVTFDLTEQIVAYKWWSGEVLVADVVRDAVTDLRIVGRARTGLEAEYGVPGYHGVLAIDVYPRVLVTDRVLRGGAT